MAVLERPADAAPVTFLDGFAAAFLAALVVPPLLVTLLIAATVGAVSTTVAEITAAVLVGALLGGSVGLAQWRACVVGRLNAVHFSPWPAAFGVGAGLAVGEMSSLGNERVRRLRAEVIPLADSLLADARAYHPPTPQIERAHGPTVATLEAAQESLSWLATALATGDADLLTRAQGRWREHDQAFERWPAAVAELPLDK